MISLSPASLVRFDLGRVNTNAQTAITFCLSPDQEVVDALGNEAKVEIRRISDTLERMNAGEFGKCVDCGDPINPARLAAAPYAERCIDCANEVERAHS